MAGRNLRKFKKFGRKNHTVLGFIWAFKCDKKISFLSSEFILIKNFNAEFRINMALRRVSTRKRRTKVVCTFFGISYFFLDFIRSKSSLV